MDQKRFSELLTGYLDGTLSEDDARSLLESVRSSETLKAEFQEHARLHVLLRESMSEQVEVNLLRECVAPVTPYLSRGFVWLAVANAAVLLVAVGVYLFPASTSSKEASIGQCVNLSGNSSVHIERGKTVLQLGPNDDLCVGDRVVCDAHARAVLRLNDGSILSMDKGSALTLVSERPEVRLEIGKTMFEIAKRQPNALPFQVQTGQSTVDVMGTVFGLTSDKHTELRVYEGTVNIIRHQDNKMVEVGMQQTVSTDDQVFAARNLRPDVRKSVSIQPTDDITLRNGEKTDAAGFLKVEADRRVAFLRFEIPNVTELESAKLRLTQEIDTGQGKLQLHLGDHSDWDESDIGGGNTPQATRVLDERRGLVTHSQMVEFDIPVANLLPGPITLILTLNKSGENDIWFGSREGPNPPELVLSAGVK